MKLHVAIYTDYTTNDTGDHILGIYDTKEKAEKRAKEYSESWIKEDDDGPLGKTYVMETTINEQIPGCPEEAYSMEDII